MFGLPDPEALERFVKTQERLVEAMERMVEIMEHHLPQDEEEEDYDA